MGKGTQIEQKAMDTMCTGVLVDMEVDEESRLSPLEESYFFNDVNNNYTLNTAEASTDPSTPPYISVQLWLHIVRLIAVSRD
jgi:hypothetical protein